MDLDFLKNTSCWSHVGLAFLNQMNAHIDMDVTNKLYKCNNNKKHRHLRLTAFLLVTGFCGHVTRISYYISPCFSGHSLFQKVHSSASLPCKQIKIIK